MRDSHDPTPPSSRSGERVDVAIALLLVQAALGLLALLGMIMLGALMPLVTPAGLLVALGLVVPSVAAAGLARGWRWARRTTIAWQVLVLVSFAFNLLLAALPQVQMEMTLSGILAGAALPIALIALVRVPRLGSVPAREPDRTRAAATAMPAPASRHQTLGA
jgi:hypothetical protein